MASMQLEHREMLAKQQQQQALQPLHQPQQYTQQQLVRAPLFFYLKYFYEYFF
jgi:hypothetical protein